METIIAALISAAVTLAVCVVNNHYQSSKIQALIEYRLEQLEKKQDKHNSLMERVFHLEERTAVQDEQIAQLKEEIKDQ